MFVTTKTGVYVAIGFVGGGVDALDEDEDDALEGDGGGG